MPAVDVSVDLYSGRPNPVWPLEGTAATRFLSLLKELPRDIAHTFAVPRELGYRGLRVTVTAEGATQRIAIGNGQVILESADSGASEAFLDSNRVLEKWLLQTGEAQLGNELLEYLLLQSELMK